MKSTTHSSGGPSPAGPASTRQRRHARHVAATLVLFSILAAGTASAQGGPPPPPPPLGPPPVPAGNPVTVAKVNLGKTLFWDEQLSSTRTVACGTCHISANGGADPRSVLGAPGATNPGADGVFGTADDVSGSPGVPLNLSDGSYEWELHFGLLEQVTGRNAPAAVDAAYSPELFWDGRAGGTLVDPISGATVLTAGAALESQALNPPVGDAEMAHVARDWNEVVARVASSAPMALSPQVGGALTAWIAGRSYAELFAEAFGSPAITPSRVVMAIASYERTLYSNETPFDAELAGIPSLSQQERDGQALFVNLRCNACHGGPLFTDDRYHYIGVRPQGDDLGRFEVTGAAADRGAFRTPGLRNVALRGPYMHDGSLATLADVIEFYDRGGDFNAPNKNNNLIRPLGLSQQQKADLLAFLGRPLTDPRVAAEQAPFDRPTLYTESDRMPLAFGEGSAGSAARVPQSIAIEPPLAGNPNFTVGVFNALGGADAVLVIDDSDPAAGGGIPESGSLARVAIALGGSGAGAGYGSVSLAIPDDPAWAGRELFGRWFVADPQASGSVAVSNGFRFTIFAAQSADTTTTSTTSSTTTSTTTSTTLPPAECPPAPQPGCRSGMDGKSQLKLKAKGGSGDSLSWALKKGDATAIGDFLDPGSGNTSVLVCVYDASASAQPILGATAVNDDCGDKPCWRSNGSRAYSYRDRDGSAAGLTSIKLKSGDAGETQIKVKGAGAGLGLPDLPAQLPITVQLIVDDGGASNCWETVFSDEIKNAASQLRAVGP